MTAVLDQVALAITALGVLAAAMVLVSSRSWRATIGVLAEMLTAAGLVRLSAEPSWDRLAAAALIVVVRRLILTSLLNARHPGAGYGGPRKTSPVDSTIGRG